MRILVTGAAGFIGMHVCKKLLSWNFFVVGIDNLNTYYDINLKKARIEQIKSGNNNFHFSEIDINEKDKIEEIYKNYNLNIIINLAAQAGVRYSINNPYSYISSNINGFLNILEIGRKFKTDHIIYASTSSVYGLNSSLPFKETHSTDHPLSLYAATKKSNEVMAHSYSSLYKLPLTGLRFFTVYGPWGRPDMALFLFTKQIIEKNPISIFNHGNMSRDFTYIDDIVEGVCGLLTNRPDIDKNFDTANPDPSESIAPFRVFNIGNGNKINLLEYIDALENEIGIKAIKKMKPMQKGDVTSTLADTSKLEKYLDLKPRTSIKKGIKEFVKWYKDYYKVKL